MPSHPAFPTRRPAKPRTMVLTALGGVVAGFLVFLVVLALAGPRSAEQSSDAPFKVGPSKRLAVTVARDGPLLFQDLVNGSRDIYVQHLGGDDWRAFEAHAPAAPRRCVLRWRPEDREFMDPCDAKTYRADGSGLKSYTTWVDDDGVVLVDLRSPVPPPS